MSTYQSRVTAWCRECFNDPESMTVKLRAHRFLEEALELVQSVGCSEHEAEELVRYVFGRPVGHPDQEAGGTMVTLAALCEVAGLDMIDAGNREIERVEGKINAIRAKEATKPLRSALPGTGPIKGQPQ